MGVVNRDTRACQRGGGGRRESEGSGEDEASFLIKATCPSRGGDIPVITIVSSKSRTLHTARTTRCFYRSMPQIPQLATSRSVDGLEVVVVVVVDNNVAVPKSFAFVAASLIAVESCDQSNVRTHSKLFARLTTDLLPKVQRNYVC